MEEKTKTKIEYVCYKYAGSKGAGILFLFYLDGQWDEDKLTLEEALDKYPVYTYQWVQSTS